ncbi:MAG: hypothetical protein KBT29_08040 [Prevotellaceae bacterium]|nr:hypothetical protein [Candidatus Minthosoma caballi]
MIARKLTVAMLLAASLVANAQNTVKTVSQCTEAVNLTEAVDYIITGTQPFATAGSVDIKNDDAVVVFEGLKPSKAVKFLTNVKINGEAAENGVNCWLEIYKNGAIVYPHSELKFSPLTVYTEAEFGGEATNSFVPYTKYTTGSWVNNFKSFKLKRGYMVTIATNSNGQGWSKVFIAQDHDIEVDFSKVNYGKYISGREGFIRVFPWRNVTKKGTAGDPGMLDELNITWRYGWDGGGWKNDMMEYIPQHHHEGWPSWGGINGLTGCNTVLGNNEPDNQGDSREQYIKPEEIEARMFGATGSWQNEAYSGGLRIGSPAMSGDCRGSWLSTFMDLCTKYNCRIDFIADHCYWLNNGGNFDWQMNETYNKYKRPIWITEWNYGANWTNWTGSDRTGSDANQKIELNAVKDIVTALENNPHVERYAFYNWVEDCRTIVLGGKLTRAGEWYGALKSNPSYSDANEYTMGWNYWSPSDLKIEMLKSSKRATLSWTHLNGKQTDYVAIERKVAEESSKWVEIANLGQIASNNPSVSYTKVPELDISDKSGVVSFRIANHDSDGKTRYSAEVSVTLGSAQGTDEYQYGKLTVTNLEPITADFSETMGTVPAVFMGLISNVNTDLIPGNLITDAKATSFKYQILPWVTSKSTTMAKNEEISFLAMKEGNYKYDDLDCEVGVVKVNMVDTCQVTFKTAFPEGVTPIVLTELRNPTAKANPIIIKIKDVTNTGFKCITMYEEKVGSASKINQNVCYLAITPGIGTMDKESGTMIAAGIGTDNQIYSLTSKSNYFMVGEETLKLAKPLIFGNLQTTNYDAATMIRRASDNTEKIDEISFTTGTRVKRVTDSSKTKTADGTKLDASEMKDDLGWVAIAKYVEGGSAPTAIEEIEVVETAGSPIVPYVINNIIYVENVDDFEVHSITGAKVAAHATQAPGIYVVTAGKYSAKVIVK